MEREEGEGFSLPVREGQEKSDVGRESKDGS